MVPVYYVLCNLLSGIVTYANGDEVEGEFKRGHLQGLAELRFYKVSPPSSAPATSESPTRRQSNAWKGEQRAGKARDTIRPDRSGVNDATSADRREVAGDDDEVGGKRAVVVRYAIYKNGTRLRWENTKEAHAAPQEVVRWLKELVGRAKGSY